MSERIKGLAASIVMRHRAGLDPYVLFLGAGSSISSGCSSMAQVVDGVLKMYRSNQFSIWQYDILKASSVDEIFGKLLFDDINKKKLAEFFKVWETLDRDTRYSIL